MTDELAARRTKVVAFHSLAGGCGCSCTLANVALMLAAQGFRVLAVDLNLAAPSLYRYLAPFLPAAPPGHGSEPVRLTCDFDDPAGSLDFLGPASDTVTDLANFAVRRGELLGSAYDYALVDIPAGVESVPLISELADTVVLAYELNQNVIARTVRHALDIRAGERGPAIRILPVPMQIHRNASAATSRTLVAARLQFSWLLEDTSSGEHRENLEIPYEPDYALDEGLAFLDEPSQQRDRLVRAYGELAAEIGARPAATGSVTARTMLRYQAARLAAASASAAVTVLHAPGDRYWAEWLAGELRDMGLTATRRRIDTDPPAGARSGSELLVVSRALLAPPGAQERLSAVLSAAASPGGRVQLGLSIDGTRLPRDRFPALALVSLVGNSAEQTHAELASFYKLARVAQPRRHHHARYPAAKETTAVSLPASDGPCHGRQDEVDQIRDHFMACPEPVPLTLAGEPGAGKTRLALEYAWSFGTYYDLMFFLRADSEHALRADLRALAEMTGIRAARTGGDAEPDVLRHLRADPGAPARWLLIYDGAESAETLSGLLPEPGRGHVLLTGRAPAVGSSAVLPVRALPPDAATAMLSGLVRGLLPAEAAELAGTLHGVPLALALAGGWLRDTIRQLAAGGADQATVVGNSVTELRVQLSAQPAGKGGPPDPIRAMTELLLRLLRMDPHAASGLLLLQTCAFLAPSGLPDRLLRSPAMLAQLTAADPDLSDLVVLNNIRRKLVSLGFAPAGLTPREPLRVHPRVREILRDRMGEDERNARSLAVARMLAASAPADIDDDVIGHAEIYAELLRHVEPSGAAERADDDVRRWLVGQVRYLWQLETTSSWRTAADLAERLAGRWAAAAPDRDEDPLLLRLRVQLANVYRSRGEFGGGEFARARAIDADVLHKQRKILGPAHPRTLMTARGYGADLRLAGKFEESLNVDQATWRAFSDTLGEDHLLTIVASSNMALAELMAGYPEQALERQQADVARCEKIKHERPEQRAWILFHIGTLQRELGRYEQARDTFIDAKADFDALVAGERLGPTRWAVLRTTAGLAITERRLGRPAIDTTRRTLKTCRDTYGDLYPDVLALELSLAGDLHALGRHGEAADQAQAARAGYARVFGPAHPFTRICEVNLAGYALAAGQAGTAGPASEAALAALDRDLPADHLWVQAAKVARANVLASSGQPEAALRLEEEAHAEYQRQLGRGSPPAAVVAANIASTRRLLARPGPPPGDGPVPGEGPGQRAMIELDTPPY